MRMLMAARLNKFIILTQLTNHAAVKFWKLMKWCSCTFLSGYQLWNHFPGSVWTNLFWKQKIAVHSSRYFLFRKLVLTVMNMKTCRMTLFIFILAIIFVLYEIPATQSMLDHCLWFALCELNSNIWSFIHYLWLLTADSNHLTSHRYIFPFLP